MKNTFVLLWEPGPAWIEGKTVREQPYWAQHADFMDPLFESCMSQMGVGVDNRTWSLSSRVFLRSRDSLLTSTDRENQGQVRVTFFSLARCNH